MNKELTDLQQLAGIFKPAAMPADMRHRLLTAMVQEEAELQADLELESELGSLYTPAPMSPAVRQHLLESIKPVPEYRLYRWRRVAAAAVVALLVLPLLWWGALPEPGAAAPVVEARRELLPANGVEPAMRRDTFVLRESDSSQLVIKVQAPVESRLPEDVI